MGNVRTISDLGGGSGRPGGEGGIYKQRSDGGEGGVHAQTWGKSSPNTGKGTCKGPGAGADVHRASEEASQAGAE